MRTFKAVYGFQLLEMIVALSVLCSLLSLGSRYISRNAENAVNKIVASHLKQVTKSAQHYVQDHFQDFKNSSDPEVNWKLLVKQGYLSENIPNKNHYGQEYQFQVSETKAGFQVLLTTKGGNSITEASLRQIADLAGSAAGYASVLHQNKIVGTHEGWILEGVPLKTGHLASLTMINEQEVMDAATFLRKTKFTDHPEYNQMQTDLFMLNNDIQLGEIKDITGTLNKNGLQLYDNKGKFVNIKINKPDSDDPNITLKDTKKTWKTEMKPAEIRMESRASGRTSYVGNDHINFTHDNNFSELSPSDLILNNNGNKIDITNEKIKFYTNSPKDYYIGGVWIHGSGTNKEISISADSLHVPYYLTNYAGAGWGQIGEVVVNLCYREGTHDRIGKLFFVNSTNYNKAYLMLCGHDGKIYINKGFSQY